MIHVAIPRRSQKCSQCQGNLQRGADYFAVLVSGEKEHTYCRHDYCSICFPLIDKTAMVNMISSWKAVVPKKLDLSQVSKEQNVRALALLKEYLDTNDRLQDGEVFVLSLYLARRRCLALRQEIVLSDGQPASIYEVLMTEEMLCIRKVPLPNLQTEKVQGILSAKLAG